MIKVESLKIVAGIILIIFSITFFLLLITEDGQNALVVLFDFNINYNASNLGEAIAAAAAGIGAALLIFLATLFIGGLYFIFCLILGLLTIIRKRNKTVTIFVLLFTLLSLVVEIRAIAILAKAELISIILTAHLIGDIIITAICSYSIFQLYRAPSEVISYFSPQI